MSAVPLLTEPLVNRSTPVPEGAVYISAPQVCDRYGGRSHMWLGRKLQNDTQISRTRYFGRLRFFEISELENYERTSAARPVENAKAAQVGDHSEADPRRTDRNDPH